MASVNDKITDTRNSARPNSARVDSGRSSGGTTLTCDNLTGWPTASKVHGVTYQIDSNENPVAGTQLDFYAIRSGNDLTSFTVVDGTDNGNTVGDIVEMLPTAAWGQDLADALSVAHERTGAHKSGATYPLPVIADFTNATHTHANAAGGGLLNGANAITDGTITPAELMSGTGSSWEWQSWTPTWTSLTLGNATVSAKYAQIGKTIVARIRFTFGSTSSISGTVSFSLPVTAHADYASTTGGGWAYAEDVSITGYECAIRIASTTHAQVIVLDSASTFLRSAGMTATNPFTWGTNDFFRGTFVYEAA